MKAWSKEEWEKFAKEVDEIDKAIVNTWKAREEEIRKRELENMRTKWEALRRVMNDFSSELARHFESRCSHWCIHGVQCWLVPDHEGDHDYRGCHCNKGPDIHQTVSVTEPKPVCPICEMRRKLW